MTTCPRCNGQKTFKHYGHIKSGICFKCNGTGKVKVSKSRKPSKEQIERETQREIKADDNARKQQVAFELYKNDSRLTVASDHPYIVIHCHELALKDNVWQTL